MFAQAFNIYYIIFFAFIFYFKTKRKGTQDNDSICMLIVLILLLSKMFCVRKFLNIQKRPTFKNLGRKESFSLIFISLKIGAKETSVN